jgi:membrane complex biogenesis BtpA family protein
MNWIQDLFGVRQPIIAMCHLRALPGDPDYDAAAGVAWVVEKARADLLALQAGGVDAVLFSNEWSIPYLLTVEPVTTATMARVIGELRSDLRVPWGVNVLWDAKATIELAVATGAHFAREIFSGVYASDFGLWNTHAGDTVRLRDRLGGKQIRLFYNIVPEAAQYLAGRDLAAIARSTEFNMRPDALCVSGLIAGAAADPHTLRKVKQAVESTPVFANTGVRPETIAAHLAIADGAVVGTSLKQDGHIWGDVDEARVRAFMDEVRRVRGS